MRTLKFNNVYIKAWYTLLGRNEHNIKIENSVDKFVNDYYMEEKCLELAECSYQVECIKGLLKKSKIPQKNIDLIIGGDLQNQLFASNYAMRKFNISFLGIYSACSSFTESLLIASSFIESNQLENVICVTSSHNLVSEKQFRFPIEYGALRKKVNTFTVTGSASAILGRNNGIMKIDCVTIGSVIDMNYKDSNNIGACMAPAAAETIYEHLKNTKRKPSYYDLILTGDLGVYGVNIMKDYLSTKYNLCIDNVSDAGIMLFDVVEGDEFAGGSGPVCLPLALFTKIKELGYKKILLVGTGSLHSALSCSIKESVVAISHAISLEVM